MNETNENKIKFVTSFEYKNQDGCDMFSAIHRRVHSRATVDACIGTDCRLATPCTALHSTNDEHPAGHGLMKSAPNHESVAKMAAASGSTTKIELEAIKQSTDCGE